MWSARKGPGLEFRPRWLLLLLLFGHPNQGPNCSKIAPGCFTAIGDKAPPAAHDGSEVAHTLNRRCCPHIVHGGHSWCLPSSLSLSVGWSHECWLVRATGGSLPWRRYSPTPITLQLKGEHGEPTPTFDRGLLMRPCGSKHNKKLASGLRRSQLNKINFKKKLFF